MPTTPHEALRSTCLIDREKRGRCVWNFTKFSTQKYVSNKKQKPIWREICYNQKRRNRANRSGKIVLNSSEMKRENRAV